MVSTIRIESHYLLCFLLLHTEGLVNRMYMVPPLNVIRLASEVREGS